MTYNLELAERLRQLLGSKPGMTEKAMFGGVGYLLNGNMMCGVYKNALIVRVGKEGYATALKEDFTRPFDITGRPMSGWLMVDPPGYEEYTRLESWVMQALTFVNTLPAK